MSNSKSRLSNGRLIGYAAGITAESILYNMFFMYFLIFLTNTAMLNPILAGAIGLISVTWDAVADPVIGYYSDRQGADKRRFILLAAVPMGLLFAVAFLPVEFSAIGKFIYYTALTMLFWLAYTLYTIPYYALGAEITQDYDERTKIRGLSSFINAFAIFIGAAGPVLLVDLFSNLGIIKSYSWFLAAATLGTVATVFALIVYFTMKNVTLIRPETGSPEQKDGLINTYISILKLKPFKWLIVFVLFYLAGSSIMNANTIYLVLYRVGLTQDAMTYVLIATVLTMVVLVPVVTWLATRLDRRTTCIIFFSLEIVGLLILKLVGITTFTKLMILASVSTLGIAAFWTVFYSMAYDLVEVDELVNNQRREGAITSFPQFVQKIGAAIGLQITGLILALVGYDASAVKQTTSAIIGIENISTLVSAAFILVAVLALIKYPITKKRFNALQIELEKKRNNENYCTDLIKDLV